jgi:Uma2 family endonuclease
MNMPIHKSHFTYKDYMKWPEGTRCEIIEGHPSLMTPAPSRIHQRVVLALGSRIESYLNGKTCEVNVAPFDVLLPLGNEVEEDITSVVQPDISVVCDPGKLNDKGCMGAPDLIVEVISPSSLKLDLYTKKALYERAGVKEYWIIYPAEKIVLVHYLDEQGKYSEIETYSNEEAMRVRLFEELVIQLSEIFTI